MKIALGVALGAWFFSLSSALSAQDHLTMNNVIPPSPNAASLGQYGEIPVDKYTGVPSVSIPLYTIQVDDITVPISLSFHSSSHKVGTTASWVGYGWSLNAGGVVTRSMKGSPDENDFFKNINTILGWEKDGIIEFVYDVYLAGVHPEKIRSLKERMWEIHMNGEDTQPDIFYYNFPNGSGKFMFNEDQSISQIPFQDNKIEPMGMVLGDYPSPGTIGGFTIKDMSGLVYTFDKPEQTTTSYSNYSTGANKADDIFYSSWYLTNIQSQRSGKVVTFSYSGPVQFEDAPNESNSITEMAPTGGGAGEYSVSSSASVSFSTIACHYIETITWEGGKIYFYRSGGRADVLVGGQKLDSVRIVNRTDEWIKSYHFNYAYFNDNRQLKLLSVREKGNDGKFLPPHTFDYYENGTMPAHNSKAQDHFGYYNGAIGNLSLVPGYKHLISNGDVPGANRNSTTDISLATLGALKALHYPTGGYTELTYELNDYYQGSSTDPTPVISETTVAATAEYCNADRILYYDEQGNAVAGLRCNQIVAQQFTTSSYASPYYTLNISIDANPVNPPVVTSGDFVVKLLNASGNVIYNYYPTTLNGSTIDLSGQLSLNTTYTLRAETYLLGTRLKSQLKYLQQTISGNDPVYNIITSGIRVAQITHNTDGGMARKIMYRYTQKANPDLSSGKSMARTPTYQYQYVKDGGPSSSDYLHTVHNASPSGLLGSLQGSHIVYTEVEEYEEGLGSTRSYFSTFYEQPTATFYVTPAAFEPASSFWKNGKLIKEETYDQSNTLLKSIENLYSYPYVDTVRGFVFGLAGDFLGATYENQFSFAITKQYSGWPRLDRTINTTYNNNLKLIDTTNYSYDIAGLILPTTVQSSTSDWIGRHEETRYTNNRVNHIISPIEEKKTYRGTSMISRDNYIYAQNKLVTAERYDHNNLLINTTTYSGHIGLKPSYVETSTGTKTVYLWGYNNTLPVAQAINASTNQVFYEGFETTGTTDNQAKAGQRSYNGDYTFVPPAGFTPTANSIITYWYWDNNKWNFKSEAYSGGSKLLQDGSKIDEVRVYPKDAQITTYTYQEGIGVSTVTDANNQTSYYEYDHFGRLKLIRNADRNIVKTFGYHYDGQ